MAGSREEHIVRLDVPVHNAPLVQVLQGEHHRGQVEDCLVLWETAVHPEERLEVAADHVLHHHEHVVGGLQAVEQGHAEF